MTAWAVEALLASAMLIALVLAARATVRRAFGPTVAYALWALPVLRLVLPPIPADWLGGGVATPLATASEQVALLILPAPAPDMGPPVLALVLATAWCAGAALFLLWQLVAYARFIRRVARAGDSLGKVGRIALVVSDAVVDPLAYGLARPVVAVPRDFRLRYGPAERELALAHEVAHHRRGDMVANWVALAVLALHWFNPLAWIAFRAFRIDQEMANDAHVLARRSPAERHAYALAIVKAATGRAPAAACGLHTIKDLKGRLRMLSHSPSRGRRAAGAATIAAATLGLLGLTASGSQAAESVRAHVEAATGVPLDALDPTALFQREPADAGADAPPALPGPTAPGSHGRHVETVREGRTTHVTVTENGRTRHYEGAQAEAWIAANPLPAVPAPPTPPAAPAIPAAVGAVPPVPPAPPAPGAVPLPPVPDVAVVAPVPPTPPAPPHVRRIVTRSYDGPRSAALAAMPDIPQVVSRTCAGGARPLVVEDRVAGRKRITICTDRIAAEGQRARVEAERAQVEAQRARVEGQRAQVEAQRARIEGQRARAEAQAAIAARGGVAGIRRDAMRSALDGLRSGRAAMAANADMPEASRRRALDAMDRSIGRMEAQLAELS